MKTIPNPFIPDQGTWLTTADGQPLASVLSANPEPQHPGCVCVHVLPHHQDGDLLLTQGTGAWRVQDRQTGLCFCVQALSCSSTGLGYEVIVSFLGEPTAEPDQRDDDYLVMPGHPPVRLHQVLIADGRCASGPHLRCEIDSDLFSLLPMELDAVRRLACGNAATADGGGPSYGDPSPRDAVHRWRFCNVYPETSGRPHAAQASVVRLRQREILDCQFHIAMRDTPGDAGTNVCIGHVVGQASWPKRDA